MRKITEKEPPKVIRCTCGISSLGSEKEDDIIFCTVCQAKKNQTDTPKVELVDCVGLEIEQIEFINRNRVEAMTYYSQDSNKLLEVREDSIYIEGKRTPIMCVRGGSLNYYSLPLALIKSITCIRPEKIKIHI